MNTQERDFLKIISAALTRTDGRIYGISDRGRMEVSL